MAFSPEIDPKSFGFRDLQGFIDYVILVPSCAPDLFPHEDWLPEDQQLDLERAFVGLRYGLSLTEAEVGQRPLLEQCHGLIEEAYTEYKEGRDAAGQAKLEKFDMLLRSLPSR